LLGFDTLRDRFGVATAINDRGDVAGIHLRPRPTPTSSVRRSGGAKARWSSSTSSTPGWSAPG
jgi:hypothetical protein